MAKKLCALSLMILIMAAGCGPDTIFLRPGLDTPAQHVSNGHQLMQRGKLDDACREFNRAKELDPKYIQAYIGLGVALGRKGDIDAGMQAMHQADQLTVSQQDRDAVQQGYRQLSEIQRQKEAQPKTQ